MSNIDHELTSETVCPYCGYELDDSYEHFVGDNGDSSVEMECGECGETFIAGRSVMISYSTSKPLCKSHTYRKDDNEFFVSKQKANFENRDINWVDLPPEEWEYHIIRTCTICDHRSFVKVTEAEYNKRLETWKEKILLEKKK